jgi:NADH-quinone oxidoreductase subunit H
MAPRFQFWTALILILVMMGVLQGICAYLILLERKISAWAQDRIGPNRVGPWGLLQPIADGLKFLFKEELIPGHVDRLFYLVGPTVATGTALLAFAVVPFGPTSPAPELHDYRAKLTDPNAPAPVVWPQTKTEETALLAADQQYVAQHGGQTFEDRLKDYDNTVQFVIAPHVNIGIVFVFAVGSLAVYGIVLGGWSSNNKYSFLGSLRSSAQLISYEIPMGLSVLGVLLVTGSLNLERIIAYQAEQGWNFIFQPVACLLFITSLFAETNRLPFDLPEAEQELVGGYHTEYSGMKFALFFLGEYTAMISTSFLVVTIFFGGWLFPWIATPEQAGVGSIILKLFIFFAKMALFIVFYMWIRWTLPRFRFDQLMGLAWKVLMPLALINVVCVMFVHQYKPLGAQSHWLLLPLSLAWFIGFALLTLRMPRARARVPVVVRGHASGEPALLGDRDRLRR